MAAFVGREQDLETVGRYFQDAAQGKGSVVFITGEAGIGKTTFINAFKARYVDAQNAASKNKKTPDIRFAEAKCSELIGKGEAYAPFIELIGRLVADDKAFGSSKLADVVREIGADWFELVPVIGKALKLVSATFFKWQSADDARQLADRKGNKEKLVQQYVQILKTMSEKHPLVLFVDDLHWADDSSIYLLFQLAREIQDRRILLLGTYRPTDIQAVRGEKAHPLKDALGEMHRFGVCKEVKLGYFTSDHIRRYLDAAFPQNRLDAEFVAYLRDLTEGNPLFVTEQVKLLQEIGKIQTSEVSKTSEVSAPVWELRGTLRDADMPIPTSVEKTIEKRFERLKEDMQETLQYASVSGEQFDAAVVAQMLQQDELAVLKKLQTLDRVYEFVREQKAVPFDPANAPFDSAQGDGHAERSRSINGQPERSRRPATRGAIYQFIHSLVQKSLYGTLSDGIKVKLHAKAAEIIETLYADQREAFAEELAAHWERGREYAKAAPYLLLSARKANRQSGYQEAKTHAQRGLEMLKSAGFSVTETRNGGTPHVETHGRASLPKTPDQAMLRLQIELLLELATAEEAVGEAKNSIGHAETALKLVEMVNDQGFQGEIYYQAGSLLVANGTSDLDRILDVLKKSLDITISMKGYEKIVNILEKMRGTCRTLEKKDFFIARCKEVIRFNSQAQKTHLNSKILQFIAGVFYEHGKYQEAYDSIVESLGIAFTTENLNGQIELLQRAIQYAIKTHNIHNAIDHYEQAKSIANSVNDLETKSEIFSKLGGIAWDLSKYDEKKYDEMFEYFRIARDAAYKSGNLKQEAEVISQLIGTNRNIGRFDEAIQYGMECLETRKKLGRISDIIEMNISIGWIFRHQGTHVKALELHQQAAEAAAQYGREGSLAHCLSLCYTDMRFLGKFREAIDVINRRIEIHRKLKDRNREIECLTDLSVFHFWIGQVEKAFSFMNQAIQFSQIISHREIANFMSMRHSQILMGTGHYQEAHVLLEKVVVDAMDRGEYWSDAPVHLNNSVQPFLVFDETGKALERLKQIELFFKRYVIMEGIAMLKDAYAQVYLAQGDLEKAESSLNEAIALFQQMNSFRLGEADLTLAALRLAQGQPSAALEAASAARKIFTDIEYYRAGEAILWQAKALFALRRFPDAQTRLKESAAEFKRLQQPHHLAEAQLLHGQLLAAAGQKEKALQNMLNAKATFAKLGLKRLEKEAERVISSMR